VTFDLSRLKRLAEQRDLRPDERGEIYLALPALVEAVEATQEKLAAIDRALDASEAGSETRRHLMFCVGATLSLREKLDRFVEPSSGGTE
jgi:predicted transcriptional regulator